MKKFLTVFIAVAMSLNVVAFSACANKSNAKGTIKADYSEITAENYNQLEEKVEDAHVFNEDAEKIGGSIVSNGEIKLMIGGKSLKFTNNATVKTILDLSATEVKNVISDFAENAKAEIKADKGFGEAAYNLVSALTVLPKLSGMSDLSLLDAKLSVLSESAGTSDLAWLKEIDNVKINMEGNSYIKDAKAYADAKITGVPDAIIALDESGEIPFDKLSKGVKYAFDENGDMEDVFDLASIIKENALNLKMSDEFMIEFDELNEYLLKIDAKLYAEMKGNGVKIKIATTETSKTKALDFIKNKLPVEAKLFVSGLTVSDLKAEFYLSIDKDGALNAIAGNISVVVSAKISNTEVSLSLSGAIDVSLEVPKKISYPSFSGYVDYAEQSQNSNAEVA